MRPMHLTSLLRGLAALIVFAATVAAFSSTAKAEGVSITITPDPAPVSDADLAAAFQRGQLSAILDAHDIMALPPEVRHQSFRTMVSLTLTLVAIFRGMDVAEAVIYFEARALIFAGFADLLGEPRS